MNAPWLPPLAREARNEQRKLRGAAVNALAIAVAITAFVGDFVNPVAAQLLSLPIRMGLGLLAGGLHLFACFLVRDIEDRS
ncbi:MAG: hypothetical protein JNJ73_11850 [Hyphomonadaceae bacterium]|nr:hypothetical protein [Hyphomonadaceae bacterium]